MLIFSAILLCICIAILLFTLFGRQFDYSGTMYVHHTGEKITYTLELDVDPFELQFRDKVVFRVETPDTEL